MTVTVEEHLQRVLDGVALLPAREVPVDECLGLVAAADVHAAIPLPAFDNSAMDGYAVRYADVAAAGPGRPVVLPVVGELGAGQGTGLALAEGTAAKIMTGARVPPGADAIVPYEWTDRGRERVSITEAPSPGQHVRPLGDDVAVGDLLVESGTRLGPRHLGLLAAVGCAVVSVHPRPRVVVVSTGSELRRPGEELGPDSIYDGNSSLLAAAVERAGGHAVRAGIVPDRPDLFLAALARHAAGADLVITSGGVSMGDYDVVKETLRARGVWFGPVAMQPGKPQGFGRLTGLGAGAAAADGVPIVTLPGNPVSSYLSFEVFVLPALRKMMGLTPWARTPVTARLLESTTSPEGRRQFLRGRAGYDDEGRRTVALVGGPGSHLVGALAHADCLAVVAEDVTAVAAGTGVPVLMLDDPL